MSQDTFNRYSIIIPSYNRSDEIRELLESLLTVDFPADRFEVIIADDGSTDDTSEVVAQYAGQAPFELHYYSQQNQGPGAARNLGMSKARGDFFIFLDSDVTVPVHWLRAIDSVLQAQKADAFGGPDSYKDDFPPLLKAINYSMTSFITTGGLRGRKGKKLARYYPRSFNMGLSRELWQKIGGFGSLRHGQDIEYSNRIIRSGVKVVYIAGAEVYHKRRTNLRRFYKQVFNWGVARINLYKIDKSMLEPLHALPALASAGTVFLIILALFVPFVRWLVLGGALLALLILLLSMIDAMRMYAQVKPALYLPLVMPAQIFGYGIGFIYNFIRRVILSRGEKSGFKKNYYK
jgi:glycosyltransferase involved in cell wall biosynthesis